MKFHLNSLISTMCLGAALLTTSCSTLSTDSRAKATFYVSPGGNDAWDGSSPEFVAGTIGPFKTIQRAQDAVRKHPDRGRQTLVVALREGTYAITAPLTFTPLDSGCPAAPVIWTAYGKEKPVISGGRTITGWNVKPDGTWSVTIPETKDALTREEAWDINQLFVNGARRQRARLPKQPDFFRMNGRPAPWNTREEAYQCKNARDEIVCHPQDFQQAFKGISDKDANNAFIVVYNSWTASLHHLEKLMPKDCRLKLTEGTGWPIGYWEPTGRYHVENTRNALTDPGEWYMDYNTGTLHYIPMPGETPQNTTVIAPVAERLLQLQGDMKVGLFVQNLIFQNLAFHHAAHRLPFNKREDGQAAASMRGAIQTQAALNCAFKNLHVAHVGGYGIDLGQGSRYNLITQCEITDMGGGGVRIGETASYPERELECGHNTLENSFIHDGGLIAPAAVGAIIFKSSYNAIRHNEICDLFYSSVSIGWSWGYAPSSANHNVVEYNKLHHLGYGILSDMGAVYTLGISPGTVVRGNTIHDVHSYSYGGWGLYTDEGSTGIVMENNLVYNTKSGGFHQHYGRENIIRNNILANAMDKQVIVSRVEPHTSVFFENNVVVFDNGKPYGGNIINAKVTMKNNIYWDTTGKPFGFAGIPLQEWQEDAGQEKGTRIINPNFKNPTQGDFTLPDDSPAKPMVAETLRAASIAGLYGDREWTDRPKNITFKKISPHMIKVDEERPAVRSLRELVIDFKNCKPGDKSPYANTSGENPKLKTSIRVTDEIDGPHSKNALKFVDAPNQAVNWQPHLTYPVNWTRGCVTGSFDVYLNSKDALLWHEWRNATAPYKVGPCVRFKGNGDLLWGQKKLATIPLKQWIHVTIKVNLNPGAPKTFTLLVTPQGQKTMTFTLDYIDQVWESVTTLLFVSESTLRSDFYVANINFFRDKDK